MHTCVSLNENYKVTKDITDIDYTNDVQDRIFETKKNAAHLTNQSHLEHTCTPHKLVNLVVHTRQSIGTIPQECLVSLF